MTRTSRRWPGPSRGPGSTACGAAPDAVDVYVRAVSASPAALRASFGPYRALDRTMRQNARRREHGFAAPVLTIAGERSSGDAVAQRLRPVAEHVEAVVLPGCGHFPAEEDPDATVETLLRFLADDREHASHTPGDDDR